jgi:hypothetical protein
MREEILLVGLEVVVVLWLTGWAVRAVRDMAAGPATAVSIAIAVHYLFSGVPLLLDLTGFSPTYVGWPTFRYSAFDPVTRLTYACYVAFCPAFWWYTGRVVRKTRGGPGAAEAQAKFRHYISRWMPVLWVVVFLPVVLLFFAPDPAAYATYGAVIRGRFNDTAIEYHRYINVATPLALVAAATLAFSSRRIWRALAGLSPLMFLTIWLNGKRNSVAIWLLLIIIVLRFRGKLRGWRAVAVSTVAVAIFGFYSYNYQSIYRTTSVLTRGRLYENARIDFGRDHGIKMAIYAELHPDEFQILEYRAQSMLFYLTFYVPRTMWDDKPWPYAVYSTAAALGIRPRYIGWGITTTWLEEAVATFSWFGLFLGPLLIALVCRIGDSTGEPVASFLSKLVVALLLTVQLAAWLPVAFVWCAAILRARLISKREAARAKRLVKLLRPSVVTTGSGVRPLLPISASQQAKVHNPS